MAVKFETLKNEGSKKIFSLNTIIMQKIVVGGLSAHQSGSCARTLFLYDFNEGGATNAINGVLRP